MLRQYPNINFVGEAANLTEAVQAVKEAKPDLVFPDIQTPGGSGFDFLAFLDGKTIWGKTINALRLVGRGFRVVYSFRS
jgi:two-component system LytT family response regulator